MGLFNYSQSNLRVPLNNKQCFLCNHTLIPYNAIPELDAFEYKCPNCNPDVVIEISGSMLASTLYDRLLTDEEAKKKLIRRIKNCKRKRYSINTLKVSTLFSNMKKESKKIKVEIVPGDYCECGCKGRCDTREVQITKNGKTTTIGYEADLTDLLQELSKKIYFNRYRKWQTNTLQ